MKELKAEKKAVLAALSNGELKVKDLVAATRFEKSQVQAARLLLRNECKIVECSDGGSLYIYLPPTEEEKIRVTEVLLQENRGYGPRILNGSYRKFTMVQNFLQQNCIIKWDGSYRLSTEEERSIHKIKTSDMTDYEKVLAYANVCGPDLSLSSMYNDLTLNHGYY